MGGKGHKFGDFFKRVPPGVKKKTLAQNLKFLVKKKKK